MTPVSQELVRSPFRAPAAAHVGQVVIQVADLDRSLVYYTGVLGFDVITQARTRARLGAHGDDRVLVEIREKRGVRPVPRRGLLGLYHFAVLVPSREDLGRALVHFHDQAISLGTADHLVSEALYLVDPDGLTIEVYRDRPRNEWQHRGSDLAMASDPIDARGLIEAAGGRLFEGLPRGTTIGHMHFYVDDLDRAASFYDAGLGLDVTLRGFPGALFMSAGGYHHHVGTNTWAAGSPMATDDDAKLIEWEWVVPDKAAVDETAASLTRAGFTVNETSSGVVAADPWQISVRVVPPKAAK